MAPRACAVRWKGYGGLLAAGFWGNAWEYQPYLSYSVTSDPLLPTTPQGGSSFRLYVLEYRAGSCRRGSDAVSLWLPCLSIPHTFTLSVWLDHPACLRAASGASGHSVSGSVKAVGWAALGAFLGAGAVVALVLVRDRLRQRHMGISSEHFYSASIN
jgi:hypothetical protein